jgi:cytochrome b561
MTEKKRVRKKIKARDRHIAVYILLLVVPVVVYLLTAGSQHLPAMQTNIDVGLSFFDWLMDRLIRSADKLVALIAAVLAVAYTLKIVRK